MPGREKLGHILTEQYHLRGDQLDYALKLQTSQHAPLGNILLHEGYINHRQLQEALARQANLPFVELAKELRDTTLLTEKKWRDCLDKGYIPLRYEQGRLRVAVVYPSRGLQEYLTMLFQCPIDYVMTSPLDIRLVLVEQFGNQLTEQACNSVWHRRKTASARQLFSRRQAGILWLMATGLLLALLQFPSLLPWLCIATCLLYAASILFKLALLANHRNYQPPDHSIDPYAIADANLPDYTVLVPLYKEAAILPELVEALRNIDYPHARLDIKLIIEEDDIATLHKAREMRLEYMFDIVLVPYSLPRTKPKACNYALHFAEGEYITIYDAEDMPDPLQLRKAVATFQNTRPTPLCLQARLNYANWDHSLLTRCFALEYAIWFDILLPGLAALGMPIPLGGTSNHFPRNILQENGRWDAYNVTEDADLGIRLTMESPKRILPMTSLTRESAPHRLIDWLKQRTRWIKGYMQTWVVHMRQPVKLWQKLGWKGFWGFQLFIGGPCLVFLLAPFLWGVAGLWLLGIAPAFSPTHTTWIISLSLLNILGSLAVHLWLALCARHYHDWKQMGLAIACFPFYWLLHSLASFRAVWQLITAPHYWDKTPHLPVKSSDSK